MADVQFTLTIPEAQKDRVIDALCYSWDYPVNKQDGEAKASFVKRMIINSIRRKVIIAEKHQAGLNPAPDIT